MTTVYVDKRAGLVLTDSRVTTTEERKFLGCIPLATKTTYGVVNQKAFYIHDRLFCAAGVVSEIDKVIQYLIYGKPVYPHRTSSCHCMLIGKEYVIHFIIFKGKLHKHVEFFKSNWCMAIGSGALHISGIRYRGDIIINDSEDEVRELIIDAFRQVRIKDIYTDDNVNLYRI